MKLGTVVESRLIIGITQKEMDDKLKNTIDEYNEKGLIVRIEKAYSASPRRARGDAGCPGIYEFVLVVGYREAVE